MPRFNEKEREEITQKLMFEGEKLFSKFGLKKVTVDDLAEAANISKGSFYAFYQNKEHLYIEINFKLQMNLYEQVKKEIINRKDLSKEEVLVWGLKILLKGFMSHPILINLNSTTWDYLRRKLPTDFFAQHTLDDSKMFEGLFGLDIEFTESYDLLAKLFQVIFQCLVEINGDSEQDKIIDIVIKGIVKQIIISD